MRSSDSEQVRLQTAGDGFLVTNERRLQFAVPRGETTVEIEVRWPGGATERWPAVPAGHEVLLIEGRVEPVLLLRYSSLPDGPAAWSDHSH